MRYNKEQRRSIFKWIIGSVFVGAFGYLTAWLMFNFAWLNRKKGKDSMFWWWMDDERYSKDGELSPDYSAYISRFVGVESYDALKESWWIAWNWHTRNSVWNLKRSKFLVESTPAEVGNNNIEDVSIIINGLYTTIESGRQRRSEQASTWVSTAGLKYIPKYSWEDIWQVNKGDFISYKTSILGTGLMWFRPTGKNQLQFRYSQCKIIEYKILGLVIWKGWRTIKLGYGNKSYVMTMKHQKIKPWQ